MRSWDERGVGAEGPCKHMVAVRLHVARQQAASLKPAACAGCLGTSRYHRTRCGRIPLTARLAAV
jgi:hypothetical protein